MMKTISIKQGAMLPGTPHEVYELFMDSEKHAQFTGDEATISRKIGGTFSTFGSWASGKNIELVPDQKIVQTWRATDWPKGHYSTITILLAKAKGGTKLMFQQTDIPASKAKDIAQGWKDFYWSPLKLILEKHTS